MKQNVNPTVIGIAIAVVIIIVVLIGYFSLHSSGNSAPPVPRATMQQQYQQRVMQERPMSRGTR